MIHQERTDSQANAELSSLRGLIEDPTLIPSSTLTEDMMSSQIRRLILSAILAMGHKGLNVDEVTILDRIPHSMQLEGRLELAEILNGPGVPKNYPAYERIVMDAHKNDIIRGLGHRLIEEPSEFEDILKEMSTVGTQTMWEYTPQEILNRSHLLLERMQEGIAGVPTGLPALDRMIQSFVPGRLTVLGGRPAMGKTAFSCSASLAAGCPVGFFSSEMSGDQLGLRFLSSMSGVPLSIATGRAGMDQKQWDLWKCAADAFRDKEIYINDKPGIRLDQIAAQARKWVYNNGVKVIFIDYLQRLGEDPRKDRVENIRQAIKSAKELSRQLDIHVVMMSQVARDVERRENKRPVMSDLDGANTIESEADHAIMLYRPIVYDNRAHAKDAEVIVVKNRHGLCGTVLCEYDGATVTFRQGDDRRGSVPF